MFCWHSCFYEGHRSLLALIVTFLVTVAFIVSEIAMVLIRGEGGEQLTYSTSKIESVLNMWKKNKWPFLSTALMLMCLVLILSGARSKYKPLLCRHDSDNEALCLDVILSLITKFAVGIYLPMKLYDFHDHLSLSPSNYNYVGNGKYKIVQDIKVLAVSKMF